MFDNVIKGIGDALASLVANLSKIVTTIKDAVLGGVQNIKDSMQSLLDGLGAGFQAVIETGKNMASSIANAVGGTLTALWSMLKRMFEWLLEFCKWIQDAVVDFFERFGDFWTLISETISGWYEWIVDTVVFAFTSVWEWIQNTWTLFWEWVESVGSFLYEFLFTLLDWLVAIPYDIFMWFMDNAMPTLSLPTEWGTAVSRFIEYGMYFDTLFPFKEILGLFAIYVALLCVVIVYRIVKSFIPVIAT